MTLSQQFVVIIHDLQVQLPTSVATGTDYSVKVQIFFKFLVQILYGTDYRFSAKGTEWYRFFEIEKKSSKFKFKTFLILIFLFFKFKN